MIKDIGKWVMGWLLSLKINKKREEVYYIIWGHIGEAVYGLSLLPELKQIKEKRINIITNEAYSEIADLYKNCYENITVLSKRRLGMLLFYSKSKFSFHKNYIGNKWEWEDYKYYSGIPTDVYVEGLIYKIKDLRIPYNTKHSKITNPRSESERDFIRIINDLKVQKNKSVLLIPYAQSAKVFDVSLWELIGKKLNNWGYKVYTNVKDETEPAINGTIPAVLPLRYVITFIEYAGSAISIRCGLTDLIAISDCDVEVLYKIEDENDIYFSEVTSLKFGKENSMYKNRWFIKNEGDQSRFIDHLEKKYINL